MKDWKIRIAPSLGGGFSGTPHEAWGIESVTDCYCEICQEKPMVFFGLYGFPDYFALWQHKGEKAILWAGSDIKNFCNGYWLDDAGKVRLDPKGLAKWINQNCENYVENEVEQAALKEAGIEAKVVPSFLGNVKDFPILYAPSDKVRLYTSVSGNDFQLYGWDKIPRLAMDNPEIEFHLYGNTAEFGIPTSAKNVIQHGRVTQEQMDAEIKNMTGALRLTEFDGFSEIVAKSLLWGQWPVSTIPYPHTFQPKDIQRLSQALDANIEGREWLLSVVNKYPWNQKK